MHADCADYLYHADKYCVSVCGSVSIVVSCVAVYLCAAVSHRAVHVYAVVSYKVVHVYSDVSYSLTL